jgi:pimeloyl-ACP methyl ester carboxylesterase
VTPAEQRVAAGAAIELGARCVARNPQLAQHLSTANVARDMRLLMRAVGDDRLNYYGLSYGTYLGATFAALFPDEVRTLVLDGVVEPTAYTGAGPEGRRTPTFNRVSSDIGTSETLARFLDLCAQEGPQRCAFAEGATRGRSSTSSPPGCAPRRSSSPTRSRRPAPPRSPTACSSGPPRRCSTSTPSGRSWRPCSSSSTSAASRR